MDLITKSIQEIRLNIPEEILTATFIDTRLTQRGAAVSLDTRIREEVIDKRVRIDCNLTGALQVTIPLRGIVPKWIDTRSAVYHIPKSMTQGRTITTALSVAYGEAAHMPGSNYYMNNMSTMTSNMGKILDSAMDVPMVSTAYVQLIGENTIYVEGDLSLPTNTFLRCYVTHDTEFSSIKPASYLAFTKMVVLAAKDHVYRTMFVKMDQAQLHFGMQLGSFREIIESYSDASEMYYEYVRETWPRVATLNDENSFRRHLKLLVGGGH